MTDVRIDRRDGRVLDIVLARPAAGNALTPDMASTIAAALDPLGDEVRVVLLRAEGEDFCTGRAGAMPPRDARATALDLRRLISDPVLDFYTVLRRLPVPLVAAVRGRAAGVGCALAGLADVAVAAETARFQIPEMNHDIAPTLVLDALAGRMGRAALARLVYARDAVEAAEAKAMGLVGMVVPDAVVETEAERIAAGLAAASPATVRAVKAFLRVAPDAGFEARRELAALFNATATAERYR